ncbi:hypothetical protein TWF225_000621 [Orbilia oligospora]|nr:hypothetical protein TWF225_000621 [Orbilia oligospora]KAF3264698.1 hypothetical protein TWF128_001150 [Orbilia oligospora]KAF3268482.1 hypothetical protein TWF217_011067 [Orbilia oligospora]KAF3280356.1 hypothetical protein TWF132_011816 [Orbilia oligospora]
MINMAGTQDQNQPLALESIFNHIVLPAQLPGKEDHDVNAISSDLLNVLSTATREFRDLTYDRYYQEFSLVHQSLSSYRQVCIDGVLNKQVLLQQLRHLNLKEQLVLHVTKQNAALIVRRENRASGDSIIFEAFETSPTSQKALEAESALEWDFPANAVSIPYSTFSATGFQEELVSFLEQASKESIKRFAAVTNKASSGAWESRDTVDPSLITGLMMTLLEATGTNIAPKILRKRVRDDVCWNDGVNPWRRNPTWLILRVALQKHLQLLSGVEIGTIQYKFMKCFLLQIFLRRVLYQTDPERSTILKAKLCRRMAKLEAAKMQAPKSLRPVYDYFFGKMNQKVAAASDLVDAHIADEWEQYCKKIERRVNPLPKRADADDTKLSLQNSGQYLVNILDNPRIVIPPNQGSRKSNRRVEVPKDGRKDFATFADKYYKYFSLEDNLRDVNAAYIHTADTAAEKCIRLSIQLEKYLDGVTGLYQGMPEAFSGLILNVLDVWVAVDKYAVETFPLLADFHPIITAEILNSLHIEAARDFGRLQKIGEYLRHRVQGSASRMSIFVDPVKGCFADRYVESPVAGLAFKELQDHIESTAEASRLRKVAEWKEKSKEYEILTQEILLTACQYYLSNDMPPQQYHDDRNCKKCYLERKARRIKITAHEHPLPTDGPHLHATLFELACPPAFAVYRDISWRIISTLALPGHRPPSDPRLLIKQYSELTLFSNKAASVVTLASSKKSFLQTHLAEVSLPTTLEKVCLPNGLALTYFDTSRKLWPGRLNLSTTFYHHFPLPIPENSPFHALSRDLDPVHPPSSYDVIASQTRCPTGMNVHEFLAYQGILGGWNRRFPSILVELASSNLNFSSEATALLIRYLTHQAGPPFPGEPLRIVHKIFCDPHFSAQLLDQVEYRLSLISSNWREVHSMDMLIMLVSRGIDIWKLHSECPESLRRALQMLRRLRTIISSWLLTLRSEIYGAETTDSSRRFSEFALWAALLGRSTYFVQGQHGNWPLDPSQLKFFIECSIMLQHSLVMKPSSLPLNLRNALIRDLEIVHSIKGLLRVAITNYPMSLSSALGIAWAQEDEDEREANYSDPELLPVPNEWWVRMDIGATKTKKAQVVLFHLLEGHLLLDGKHLGQLPPEHRNNPILRTLFGNRNLLTVPSRLSGMTYMISAETDTHRVHLGFRNGEMIVRAEWKDLSEQKPKTTIIEYVPVSVFRNEQGGEDLPASLLDDCYHWLDLQRKLLFCRKACWKRKDSDWTINLESKEAMRRGVKLVDRSSVLFKKVAAIFNRFELDRYLTVFQPKQRPLSVEMRRLELKWEVNSSGFLESDALQSFIDRDQDPGTWYGLRSKIVLRDSSNGRSRSIIVPMGQPRCRLNGLHVEVDIINVGAYGRYQINTILGRVDCPPEPRLLYTKALIHAYTSFILPDPLTKRTGTEESLHCLRSGYCQPWTPLNPAHYPLLELIANLTPMREYYPIGLKVMQKVTWGTHVRSYAQNEHFFFVVKEIVAKSEQLRPFSREKPNSLLLEREHRELYKRSKERRGLYERNTSNYPPKPTQDLVYESRGHSKDGQVARQNVYATTYHLHHWNEMLSLPCDLAGILEKWQNIGGFGNILDKILLSDKLSIDLPLFWGSLISICQESDQTDRYKLMFLFATLVYNSNINMDAVRTLISFATNPALKSCELPIGVSFDNFRRNPTIKAENLRLLIKPYCKTYIKPEIQTATGFTLNAKLRKRLEAAEMEFLASIESECTRLINHLLDQWPCLQPTITLKFDHELIDMSQVLPIIQPEWSRLFFNLQLSNHTQEVQRILDLFNAESQSPTSNQPPVSLSKESKKPKRFESRSCLAELLRRPGPKVSVARLRLFLESKREVISSHNSKDLVKLLKPPPHTKEMHELEGIILDISRTDSVVRKRYAQDLQQSLNSFKKVSSAIIARNTMVFPIDIGSKIEDCLQRMYLDLASIQQAVEGDERPSFWLKMGNLLPCVTVVSLLEAIRSCNRISFGPGMQESLILLGLSITEVQQLIRVETYRLRNDSQKSAEEEQNMGHQNWEPLEYPDWLLLEIDGNILIRPDQVEVAHATIQPASGNNSVLQMNMGQGKTSCIMPMAAAVLADSKRLLRVVVPRALLLQTVQIIHARLGGLVGREVRHVPFSRQTSTSPENIKAFHDIHLKILRSSGLMICLPEHTLSFMLSGLQRLSDGRIEEARPMVRLQSWLDKFSRDVLDESDFTLAVRTQLIYPSGSQKAFDGHPHRWKTAEALLQLVESYLHEIQDKYPRSIEVVRRPTGGFPFIYFLRRDAEEMLIKRLVDDICTGKTSVLPTADMQPKVQRAVKEFISEAKISVSLPSEIRMLFSDKGVVLKTIYLLRGLFVHRILLLALKKRWNVQYGLHPTRDPVAVPYHAKGVPSEQAEWGHPDVAILFTCLSFYYHGLSIDQLGQSLRYVLQSDDPASEYDRWTHSSESLPGSLKEWNSINVDDEVQLTEIWGHVRYNVVVIDHFLNNFVFPRHAKQFLTKLQASGWDIPLFSDSESGHRRHGKPLTTGFSGTNDNKTMLPLTVTQEDLPTLSHTNAEVLTYLLQKRNRGYCLAADTQGRRWSETGLLRHLKDKGIRILIDAGAQILELDNLQLVKAWMAIDFEAPAAIYFDKSNKPFVFYRNNSNVPLLATPYAEDSADCLIYLDESHTRGTDLKMPAQARGALTLGLGQTKDHTVQAAMRLRKLGTTQSIMFFAPPEVHQSIVDTQQKQFYSPMDSQDVVAWLLQQTCAGIEQLQPLYFAQGMDFCRRIQAASDNPDFLEDPRQLGPYLNTLRQPEQQTLRQMYEPKQGHKASAAIQYPSPEIGKFMDELKIRRRGFQDTGEAVHGSALQEVEQEREVAFEIESVREVQKPIHYTPYKFGGLHKDLVTFVHTGRALVGTGGYEPAFLALRRTCSLGEKYSIDHNATSGFLYSSMEFSKTIHPVSSKFNDNFQRPVNWILISTATNIAIIVTPEEAEYLIPHVSNRSRESPVHLVTYAAPITRKMVQFDTLKFLSIPPLPEGWKPPAKLSVELGIIAGRLYFAFEHSPDLKDYLGLTNEGLEESIMAEAVVFTEKPLSFLQEWLTLKRKGQDFLHTPMGYLCQSKALLKSHPFFKDGTFDEVVVVEKKVEDIDLDSEDLDKVSQSEIEEIQRDMAEAGQGSVGPFGFFSKPN